MKNLFVVGLTGQTGAGKSTLCDILRKRGIDIIDCDKIARSITEKGSPVLDKLAYCFGNDILENGILNRKKLARRAFTNQECTLKLNNITHPAITELILAKLYELDNDGKKFAVIDAPTLFEAGADKFCDYIICVLAQKETRIKRIMLRDNISKEMALSRIKAQKMDEYYIEKSDFPVNNDNGISNDIVETLLSKITLAREAKFNV